MQHTPKRTTHFGAREVAEDEKAPLVGEVFRKVAPRYDLMNDAMSGGLHRLWKRQFVQRLLPRPGEAFLDLAGGTGDIAFLIGKAAPGADITLCDINPAMLEEGRDRQIDRNIALPLRWICGNAESLPFPDMAFNAVTIAFGIRNVTRIDKALAEIRRVLKPGGRFFCLEFSRVEPTLAPVYDFYSFQVIPRLGKLLAGDSQPYQYLVESIRRFPPPQEFAKMCENAGLSRVAWEPLSLGVVAIHQGWRI